MFFFWIRKIKGFLLEIHKLHCKHNTNPKGLKKYEEASLNENPKKSP